MSSKKPSVPSYSESPETTELKKLLLEQSKSFSNIPYQDLVDRFSVPESELQTNAVEKQTALMDTQDYTPTTYEDFLKQISPDQTWTSDALSKYQNLINTQDYSLTDYKQTEQDYLDVLLRKYNEARGEAWKPVQENLIAENLFSSGPGIGKMAEFGEETATGVGDISKTWAYEGIAREQTQQQYMDALKRGDYTTMYNLALQDEQKKTALQTTATNLAQAETQYYDALERGDINTAFSMSQILGQNEVTANLEATQTQLNALANLQSVAGTFSEADLKKYQTMMSAYEARLGLTGTIYKSNTDLLTKVIGAAGTAVAPAA